MSFYAMFMSLRNFIMVGQYVTISTKVKLFGMTIPSLGLWPNMIYYVKALRLK